MNFATRVRGLLILSVLLPALSSGIARAAPGPKTIPMASAAAASERPKLILMVVIDQFRADYLTRFRKLFKPAVKAGGEVGGFEYLMTRGAYYPDAEYDILQCMTGPGHATVLTGAYPYQAGIPSNDWWDEEKKARVYCAEDQANPTVASANGHQEGKADPATAGNLHVPVGATVNPHAGTSPRNLIGTTVGDELKNAGYSSRVVSIALKDRAAILMGGHRADLALWFDTGEFSWVSSKYYLPDGKLPGWVEELNAKLAKQRRETYRWDARGAGSGLSLKKAVVSNDPWNMRIGPDFPHDVVVDTKTVLTLPLSLDMTTQAAVHAMDEYKLGRGTVTDLLAVSYSSHDYVGHAFGPNSREMEEMTLADDRAVSELLNHLRKTVPGGLKDVVVVLTGDHGVSPTPEWLNSVRVPAGKLGKAEMVKGLDARLTEKFGKAEGGWIPFDADFNFYLNHAAMREKKLESAAVEAEAKSYLAKLPGVAYAFTASDYQARRLPPGMHERQILKTYFPGRSGEVMIIPRPFYMIDGDSVTHMTGYTYDRTVPLILSGFHVKAGRHSNRAEIIDIAPTLSFLTGTVAPNLSEGRVLSEALTE